MQGDSVKPIVTVGPAPAAPSVEVTASLSRGKAPRPGMHSVPYIWRDVVETPPPRTRHRGAGAHVVYHGTEEGGDMRLSYVTILRVDPGDDLDSPHDDLIRVDERVSVQRRALQEWIDRERAFSDDLAIRWRSRLAKNLAGQRRAANRLRAEWAIRAAVVLIRLQAKVGFAAIGGVRSFLRSLVHVPDIILTRATSATAHLSTRLGRRNLASALRDPSDLPPNQKGVVLLLGSALLLGTMLLLNAAVTLVTPGFAQHFRHVLGDFSASLLSTLALPFPQEPLLILSVLFVGPVLGFLGLFLGKMVGSWILYVIGDTLFDTIDKQTAGKPRLKRLVDWMQRSANKSGFWLLIPINAIPLVPDVLVYAFAVSGMRYRPYMAGIAIGTAIKFLALIAGLYLVGPERVSEFLAHPIRSITGG